MADRRSPPIRDGVDGIADEAKAESRRNAKPTSTRRTKEKRAEDDAKARQADAKARLAETHAESAARKAAVDAEVQRTQAAEKAEITTKRQNTKRKADARKAAETKRRQTMHGDDATANMGATRISAMAKNEASEKLRKKMEDYMAASDKLVHKQLSEAIKAENQISTETIQDYYGEIQDIYHRSATAVSKGLKEEFVPMLEQVLYSVGEDDRLSQDDKDSLIGATNTAIRRIKEQQTWRGQIKSKVSSLINNDVVVAALAGAATRSPLIALGVFAWKRHKKSGTSRRELDQKLLEQKITHAKKRAMGAGSGAGSPGTGPAAPPAGAGTPTDTSASPDTPATPAGTTGATTATPTTGPTSESSPLTSGGAGVDVGIGSHLLEVVRDHTRLLTGIFSNTTEIAKLMERMRDQAAHDAEETSTETPTATRADTTPEPAGEDGEDGKKGSGLVSSLLGALGMSRGFGIVSKFFKGGGVRGLAKTAAIAAVGLGGAALGTASRAVGGAAVKGAVAGAAMAKGAGALIRGALLKRLPVAIAKMGGKSIPLLGAAIAIGGGILAALKGDWVGAGLEAVSGLGSALTAIPLTIASLARSVYMDVYGIDPIKDPDVNARMSEVTNAVQAAVMEKIKGQQPTPTEPERITTPTPTPRPRGAPIPNIDDLGASPTPRALPLGGPGGPGSYSIIEGVHGPGATPTGPGDSGPTATRVPEMELSGNQLHHMELIKASLAKRGITDPKFVTSILANVMKESQGHPIMENMRYGNTPNNELREIFKTGTTGKTDEELNVIKKDQKAMAEMVYGKDSVRGKEMLNNKPGDGWKYRGRGFIQLTGKRNYTDASHDLYGDDRLVQDPDLVLAPQVAADVTAWHMSRDGNIAKKLGIDTANMTQAQSDRLATSIVAGSAIGINHKNKHLQSLVTKVNTFSANLGDTSQAGRAAVRRGMIPKAGQPGMGQPVTVVAQGGNTNIMGGGGNSRGAMPIPAPVDREPTMRRMLG